MTSRPPSAILRRPLAFFWLKALGTPAFMTLFFMAYFAVLRNPSSPPVQMPRIAPDHWIAFQPAALVPYVSLWLYVILPSALMVNFRELAGHTLGALGLSVAGLSIFMLWPTATPPADVDWSLYPHMRFLKNLDTSGNACPSLHVAFAVFAARWLGRLLARLRARPALQALNLAWAALIVYSTIAIRQHVTLDVIAGLALGVLATELNLRLCPEPPETASAR